MAIECCLFSLFLWSSLPKIPEGAFWLMGYTGINSFDKKIKLGKIQKNTNCKPEKQLTSEERKDFLENILPSEIIISILINLYVREGTCLWLSIEKIFSFIENNIYCKAKIPEKSRLEEEIQDLHKLGYTRFLPENPRYIICQPSVKELIDNGVKIFC